jgi:hypothetical protein
MAWTDVVPGPEATHTLRGRHGKTPEDMASIAVLAMLLQRPVLGQGICHQHKTSFFGVSLAGQRQDINNTSKISAVVDG